MKRSPGLTRLRLLCRQLQEIRFPLLIRPFLRIRQIRNRLRPSRSLRQRLQQPPRQLPLLRRPLPRQLPRPLRLAQHQPPRLLRTTQRLLLRQRMLLPRRLQLLFPKKHPGVQQRQFQLQPRLRRQLQSQLHRLSRLPRLPWQPRLPRRQPLSRK